MDDREARRRAGLLGRRAVPLAQGNVFHAPGWFTAALPALPLDGEIWAGRKTFQRTSGIVAQARMLVMPGSNCSSSYSMHRPWMHRWSMRYQQLQRVLPKMGASYATRVAAGALPGIDALRNDAATGHRAGRRGHHAAAAGIAVRSWSLDHAAQGQDVPGRRGGRDSASTWRWPSQRPAGSLAGRSCPTARSSRSAPAFPTPNVAIRRPSAAPSPSATRN